MGKLTKAQVEALEQIQARDGYLTPWCIGTRTGEALRARGLVRTATSEPIPFGGRWGYDPYLWITDSGREALAKTTGAS